MGSVDNIKLKLKGQRYPPFTFRNNRGRIDWKQLASVDISKIVQDMDIVTLQKNVSNVTFCDIETEIGSSSLDGNFVKLYRLSQLIIQYLMYSQGCLTQTVSVLEKELTDAKKQLESNKILLEKKEKRRKLKYRKVFDTVDDTVDQHQCTYCPKLFINKMYLQFHVQRRHVEDKFGNVEIKKALTELKEIYTEKYLEVAQNKTELAMERSKVTKVDNFKEELEIMFKGLLSEMKIMTNKCNNDESSKQVEKSDDNINLANSEYQYNLQYLKQLCSDMETEKNNLKTQVVEVTALADKLQGQHWQWNSYFKDLKNPHAIDHASHIQDNDNKSTALVFMKKDSNTNSLNEQQLSKNLYDQSYAISKGIGDIDVAQDESTSEELPFNDGHKKINLEQKTSLVDGMRNEVKKLLDEKLKTIGILPNTAGLEDEKLHIQFEKEETKRKHMFQKYGSLMTIRDDLKTKVDQMAKEKISRNKEIEINAVE